LVWLDSRRFKEVLDVNPLTPNRITKSSGTNNVVLLAGEQPRPSSKKFKHQ
jgi:hypothetical protein